MSIAPPSSVSSAYIQHQGSFSRTLTSISDSASSSVEASTYEGDAVDHPGETSVWDMLRFQHRAPASSASLRTCLRKPIHGQKLHYEATSEGSTVRGAFRCGSSFCPSCGKAKTARMASKLEKAIRVNFERGGESYFLTLTIPNDRPIDQQRDLLSASYRAFSRSLSGFLKDLGVKRSGLSWSYDATFRGAQAKAHLHLHVILFLSSPVELDEQTLFELWEGKVQKVEGRSLYLSRKAFYAQRVDSHQATARYVFKHIKSSLELANSKGKSFAFWSLLERASRGDAAAIRAHSDTLKAFFNRSWSHLGKYASDLAGEDEEDQLAVRDVPSGDAFVLEVPPVVHGLILDSGLIALVLDVMVRLSSIYSMRASFTSAFDGLLSVYEGIKDTLSYEGQLSVIRETLSSVLGSFLGHFQGLVHPRHTLRS